MSELTVNYINNILKEMDRLLKENEELKKKLETVCDNCEYRLRSEA